MITVQRSKDNEYLVGDLEIISSAGEVLRRVWLRSDGTVFLDVVYEYDSIGNLTFALYLDDQYDIIGTDEYQYCENSQNIISRIERDCLGNELHRYDYKYNENGIAYKVELFNKGNLVEYGLL